MPPTRSQNKSGDEKKFGPCLDPCSDSKTAKADPTPVMKSNSVGVSLKTVTSILPFSKLFSANEEEWWIGQSPCCERHCFLQFYGLHMNNMEVLVCAGKDTYNKARTETMEPTKDLIPVEKGQSVPLEGKGGTVKNKALEVISIGKTGKAIRMTSTLWVFDKEKLKMGEETCVMIRKKEASTKEMTVVLVDWESSTDLENVDLEDVADALRYVRNRGKKNIAFQCSSGLNQSVIMAAALLGDQIFRQTGGFNLKGVIGYVCEHRYGALLSEDTDDAISEALYAYVQLLYKLSTSGKKPKSVGSAPSSKSSKTADEAPASQASKSTKPSSSMRSMWSPSKNPEPSTSKSSLEQQSRKTTNFTTFERGKTSPAGTPSSKNPQATKK